MKILTKITLSFLFAALLGAIFCFFGLQAKPILTKILIAVAGIATVGGIAFGVSKSIVVPLSKSMDFLRNIGMGDVSGFMPMGKAVNCSSTRNCGRKTCPSFGKEDHCWVNSGSYAVVKHCPRAKKGIDCRTCDLYGAKTEMEQLGSIIMGLSNYFTEREKLALQIANGDLTKEVEGLKSGRDKAKQRILSLLEKMEQIAE